MNESTRRDTVAVAGTGSYDTVDCEEFRVAGTATVSGNLYASTVSVDGTANVGGRMDAGSVDVDGTMNVDSDARAKTVETDGTVEFGGNLTVDRLAGDGTARVRGDASVDRFVVDGSTTVEGNLDAHQVESDGGTTVGGSVVAAEAAFDGNVTVGGLTDVTDLSVGGTGTFDDVNTDVFTAAGALRASEVSTGQFELVLHGDSEADVVEGTEILVSRPDERAPERGLRTLVDTVFGKGNEPVFEVGTVVGETVDVDATGAATVVGERVSLGPDADVGLVYTDDLDAADQAEVGEVRAYDEF